MINQQIWEMYKASERGKQMIELFSFYQDEDEKIEEKIEEIATLFVDSMGVDYFLSDLSLVAENIEIDNLIKQPDEESQIFFERLIDNFELRWIEEDTQKYLKKSINPRELYIKKRQYRKICSVMNVISFYLYYSYSDYYPILYTENFDIFIGNCDALGIELPDMPNSQNLRGRLIYYWSLCQQVNAFSVENNLSQEECCACLYDYATMLQSNKEQNSTMPAPTNIWFTGASKEDYKTTLQNLTSCTTTMWACNETTKRGDIVVLYCLSPHSYVHSIWRADKDGIVNPFNYYYGRTAVTKPIKVEPIALSDLKTDNYWSQVPIVRKNLQGINGVQLSAQDYDELLRMLTEKGFNTQMLPKLYAPTIEATHNIKSEKDVEEHLLIPLLEQLGYVEGDWQRQLSQKAGRGLKAIPDFVFFPKGERYFQNAPMVIEAKLHMHSANEKMNAFNQALSYCKMMSAEILGLCDKERLMIYKRENGVFNRFKPLFEKHWGSLSNKDNFMELKRVIGKDVIRYLK